MRKKVEEKKEFNLEEAFALWKQNGKNGEYLKGRTTSECGDCEIWGFYAKEKKWAKPTHSVSPTTIYIFIVFSIKFSRCLFFLNCILE